MVLHLFTAGQKEKAELVSVFTLTVYAHINAKRSWGANLVLG